MSESTINLLLQIPLAGVVVVVVILFLRFLEKMYTNFMDSQSSQMALFMAAIKEQREQNNRALNEITHGFSSLVNSINMRLEQMAAAKLRRDVTQTRKHNDDPDLTG